MYFTVVYENLNMKKNENAEKQDLSTPVTEKGETNETAARGKKAIDAGHVSAGEDPQQSPVKEKEKEDAETWRNEG